MSQETSEPNTHLVYKLVDKQSKEVVYIGSGLPSRPNASLNHSHVDDVRQNKDNLDIVRSKLMPEHRARHVESRLIKKYQPKYNTKLKRLQRRWEIKRDDAEYFNTVFLDLTEASFDRKVMLLLSVFDKSGLYEDAECSAVLDGSTLATILKARRLESGETLEWEEVSVNSIAFRVYFNQGETYKVKLTSSSGRTRLYVSYNIYQNSPWQVEEFKKIQSETECNTFIAALLSSFFMIHSVVKKVTGVEFFTKEEQRKVWKRDIGIYSVGYADYVKIENRDKYWPFLAFVCTTQINVEGKHTGLMEGYLGVRAVCWNDKISYTAVTKDWGKVRKKGLPIGDTTGLLLKKQIGKANGYGCLMYLKDHEVRAKAKGVFTLNSVKVAELGSQAKGEFESQLIRMDNVFQHNYIREWVNIRRRQLGLQSVIRVTVANAEDLFDDRNIIKNMISQMRNDLGIRIVLGAPSLERIEKLKKDPLIEDKGLKDAVVKLVSYWTTLDSRWDGSRFEWDSALDFKKLGVPRSTLRVAYQWLVSREYLDVDLPYDFYVNLNQVRTEYFKTVTDNRVISMFLLNFKDPNRNDPDIEEVKARLLKQSRLMTKEMRLKVVPPPPRTKQAILKNMVT